ncbi:MAG: NfeD family protein [Coriobacteriales bacterium]|jgi:membrane protein implicated in regulation of membrane protease activity|nr:NfeD family protein [Coriobacteriales bacterium]
MIGFSWFWVWVILAAALCIGEMFTATFYLLPFGLGAIAAVIANALGADLLMQWLLFAAVSVVALIFLRPLARKLTRKESPKTGVERLIGMTGEVIEGTAPAGESRARVDREVWNIALRDSSAPAPGSRVRVLAIDGTHLIVELV